MKFRSLEAKLIEECSIISLNQPLNLEDRSAQLNSCVSFQELVLQVGVPKLALYGASNWVFNKRHVYGNRRKTKVSGWVKL